MASLTVPRELRTAYKVALDTGWTVTKTGSGHLKWKSPAGPMYVTGSTPCAGSRTTKNMLTGLRRAGLAI